MLVGRRAFDGTTIPDVIAQVIERDADWQALPRTIDPAIRRLLHRCLEKDPSRRLQTIDEARVQVDNALKSASASPMRSLVFFGRTVGMGAWIALAMTIALASGLPLWLS